MKKRREEKGKKKEGRERRKKEKGKGVREADYTSTKEIK